MNILDSLKWRYAVKQFDTEAVVSEQKIEILKNAFNLTATSYGLQPIKLVVIQNKNLQKELVPHSMDQQQIASASHVLVICRQEHIRASDIDSYFERIAEVREVDISVIEGYREYMKGDITNRSEVERDIWSGKQAYIALGTLLTACALEHIDSCPMEGFSPQGYSDLLGLKEKNLVPVILLPVGYRAADDEYQHMKKVRKPLDEAVLDIKG